MKDYAVMWGPFCVLMFEGDGAWVAQGVNYDLCVQAPNPVELKKRFWKHVATDILFSLEDGTSPLEGTTIPTEYIIRYQRAKDAQRT